MLRYFQARTLVHRDSLSVMVHSEGYKRSEIESNRRYHQLSSSAAMHRSRHAYRLVVQIY
jgi:hypothetical protein